MDTDWLENLWAPLGVGILLLAIAASFTKGAKEKVWAPLARTVARVFTIRLTTSTRLDAAAANVAELGKRLSEADDTVSNAASEARVEIEATRSLALYEMARDTAARNSDHQREMVALRTTHEAAAEAAFLGGREQGRAEALAEVAAERALPLLRPEWRIVPLEDDLFLLNNTQSGVVVSDISIQAMMGSFEFVGDSQWPGEFSGSQTFRGERIGNGRIFGVDFIIYYRDRNGDAKQGKAWIDKAPRGPRTGIIL